MKKALLVVAVMIPIALLHFVTGPNYRGPFPLFVNGYLLDILLPFGFYFLLCLTDSPILNAWVVRGALVFLAASFVELAQFKGLPLFGRTFDPWDILMYGLGILLAIICDQLLLPRLFSFWPQAERLVWSPNNEDEDIFFWRHN